MKRILLVGSYIFGTGGIETFWNNALEYMDLKDIRMDYLTPGAIVGVKKAEEMAAYGVNIIPLGLEKVDRDKTPAYKKIVFHIRFAIGLMRQYRKVKYDCVHVNIGAILPQTYALVIGRMCGVPQRVSHSHNTGKKHSRIRSTMQRLIVKNATDLLACSPEAAEDLFGPAGAGRAEVLKNGIDARRFAFSETARQACREQLGVGDGDFLIGHVGRFAEQKNHRFLIDVFRAVAEVCPEARLLLLGEGELEAEIRSRAEGYGLGDRVIFAGVTAETERYYSAMDLFVLPSLYEGLGIVNLEAQASGLYCVVSDVVPRSADVSGRVTFLPLGDVPAWRDGILRCRNISHERGEDWRDVCDAGYDSRTTARKLMELYAESDG